MLYRVVSRVVGPLFDLAACRAFNPCVISRSFDLLLAPLGVSGGWNLYVPVNYDTDVSTTSDAVGRLRDALMANLLLLISIP